MLIRRGILIIFITALFLWIAGYITFVVSTLSLRSDPVNSEADAVVVLTGGALRINTGLDLLAGGRANHIFISGVHEDVSLEDILENWASESGEPGALPDCCIELGHESDTTYQNAREVRNWLAGKNFDTIRLVTSNYHMLRSYMELKSLMPELTILKSLAETTHQGPDSWFFWKITFSDYNKLLVRRLQIMVLGNEA